MTNEEDLPSKTSKTTAERVEHMRSNHLKEPWVNVIVREGGIFFSIFSQTLQLWGHSKTPL